MGYVLKIMPKAIEDVRKGFDYYNGKQKGLGKRFASVVKNTFAQIKKMPFSASLTYGDTRYKVIAKFPYIVLYRIRGNIIFIARVFNTYQQPVYES